MDITQIQIDFPDLVQTVQKNWDGWPWQRENETVVLQTSFKHLDWILWIALPPKGMWWGLAPVLGFSLDHWLQQQKDDAKVFKEYKMELRDAEIAIEDLPNTLMPYSYVDNKGHPARIGYSVVPQNILLFCSWLTPATDDYRRAFVPALADSITQLEEWNLRPDEGDPESQELLAINQARAKPISFSALERSGRGSKTGDGDLNEYIRWLNAFETASPKDFCAAQLRHCSIDIYSWSWIDIDSMPMIRELVTARVKFLQRLKSPFLYWAVLGARAALRNSYQRLKTQQAKSFAKEIEDYVDAYTSAVCRRYPAFKHDLLAAYAERRQG